MSPPANTSRAVSFKLHPRTGGAFFSHQVGGFLGVWLGGILFERTGSYNVVWWLSVAVGGLSGLINLPMGGQPIVRVEAEAVPA